MEEMENPEIISYTNGYLIDGKGGNNIQWREDIIFHRSCWKIWKDKDERMKLGHSLLLFSGQVMPDSLWCHGLQQASLSIHHHLPEFAQVHIHCISSDAIQHTHLCDTLLLPSIFPISWQFASDGQSIRDSASVAESNDYSNDYFWADFQWLYWLVWSLCCPRNSQESSPAPQFKSINSTVFCHLYGPAQASICEYRKDHSLEYKDICWRSGVCFSTHVYISQSFSAKKYSFSNLMAGVILEHKRENMSLLSIFPLIFAMEWWDWVLWLEFS